MTGRFISGVSVNSFFLLGDKVECLANALVYNEPVCTQALILSHNWINQHIVQLQNYRMLNHKAELSDHDTFFLCIHIHNQLLRYSQSTCGSFTKCDCRSYSSAQEKHSHDTSADYELLNAT